MTFLLMALVMAAQPKSFINQIQSKGLKQCDCDVVNMDMQNGKMVFTLDQQASENASVGLQHYFSYYNPKQSPCLNEDQSTDSATVTLIWNLQEEELVANHVEKVWIYNNEWDELHRIPYTQPDGTPIRGIIAKAPIGIYDIYTSTLNSENGSKFNHIDELVTIDKDTTIYLDVIDAENRLCWDIYNGNNELLIPQTITMLDHDPWYEVIDEGNVSDVEGKYFLCLNGFGYVLNGVYGFGAILGDDPYIVYNQYVNNLSDRYHLDIIDWRGGNDGTQYVNKITCDVTADNFPLKNESSDYVAYEEQFHSTPKETESSENPTVGVKITQYWDNQIDCILGYNGGMPIGEGCVARAMINAPKNSDRLLECVNIAVKLVVGQNYGPNLMVNEDQSIDFLIDIFGVTDDFMFTRTPEIGTYADDYPSHPKFSYISQQKKGIVGNSCPLIGIASENGNMWRPNTNMIVMAINHLGRYGEMIRSGKDYSTMTAKYNGEEIWNGKFALDSLRLAWCGTQPDGAYELEFTNTNVLVDDIFGKNVTTVYFDQTNNDQNPPVLSMLQFRDAENNVTDRFDTPNNATIIFSGGDFDPRSTTYIDDNGYEQNWNYFECQPMTVEVSYAPYGTEEWQTLEGIEHESEFDDIPGMGFFYSGSLASVSVPSENKWYDLKFRLVDESGNWQEQTVSPAFKIESLTPDAITEVINGDATEVARYSVDGRRITSPEPGVNIVVMSDGTTRKVLVK